MTGVCLAGVSSRLGSRRLISSAGNWASSALPLAVQYAGNRAPTRETTISERCGAGCWAMKSTCMPSSTPRSTVSLSSRESCSR